MTTVRFTPQAIRNLNDLLLYIRERNPFATDRVSAAISQTAQTLAVFPQGGRLQASQGVRKLVVRKYNHLIYYRIDDDEDAVDIIAIQHAARSRGYADL